MRFDLPVTRLRGVLLASLMLAVVLAFALPVAAMATPLTHLDVTLLLQAQGTNEPLLLIAGRLPEGTVLPAEIVLPVPPGVEADVLWAGEILGGPLEDDPEATPRYEVRDGASVLVMELTRSLTGQVEIVYPTGTSVVADDVRTGGFDLVAPGSAGVARLAVAFPPGFQATSLPEGVLTSQAESGIVYYYVERNDVAPGDSLGFQVEYTGTPLPQTGVPASAPQSPPGDVPPFLVVLISAVLAGAALLALASRSKTSSEDEDIEAEPADELAEEEPSPEPGLVLEQDEMVASPGSITEPGSFLTPKVLLIGIAALVLILVVVLNLGGTGGQVGVTESSGAVVSQRISTASADSQVDYGLMISCSCPPEEEAAKMFEALGQVPGVAHAAFDTATLVMSVQFDPGMVDKSEIENRLRAAGYLP